MRRQAMHEHCAGVRQSHERVVHLIRRENAAPNLALMLLAHRGPRIGVHGIGARDSVGWIPEEAEPRSVPGDARGLLYDRMGKLVRFGTGNMQMDPEHR